MTKLLRYSEGRANYNPGPRIRKHAIFGELHLTANKPSPQGNSL